MKKPLLLAVLAAGVVTVIRKRQAGQADSATWRAATAGPSAATSAPSVSAPVSTTSPSTTSISKTPDVETEAAGVASPEPVAELSEPAQAATPAVAEQVLAEEVSTDATDEAPAPQADAIDEQVAAEKVADVGPDKDLPST